MSKYPLPKFTNVEKKCFFFMKNLNQEDFSFMGQPSALGSYDDKFFLDEIMGGAHLNGGNLFGSTNITYDRNSLLSFGVENNHNNKISTDVSDA